MVDQSGSTRFRARFESALQAYQKMTGISLTEHPLAVQLQNLDSVESITTILKHEAREYRDLPESRVTMQSIENIVSLLFALSATASFRDAIYLVRKDAPIACFRITDEFLQPYSPAKAIFSGLAILFSVCAVL
jgi:hypothetical protein